MARYSFNLGNNDGFVQAAFVHVGERTTDLRTTENSLLGNLPAYNSLDLSAGIQKNNWTVKIYMDNAFNKLGARYKFTECGVTICAAHYDSTTGYGSALYPNGQVYTGFSQPRTFGISFKQDFWQHNQVEGPDASHARGLLQHGGTMRPAGTARRRCSCSDARPGKAHRGSFWRPPQRLQPRAGAPSAATLRHPSDFRW